MGHCWFRPHVQTLIMKTRSSTAVWQLQLDTVQFLRKSLSVGWYKSPGRKVLLVPPLTASLLYQAKVKSRRRTLKLSGLPYPIATKSAKTPQAASKSTQSAAVSDQKHTFQKYFRPNSPILQRASLGGFLAHHLHP